MVLALPLLFSPESLSFHDYLRNPPTQRDIVFYALILGVLAVQGFILALLGEYVMRIQRDVEQRPLYVIDEVLE